MITAEDVTNLIGAPASQAYRQILLSNHDLSRITIYRYPRPPSLQDRIQQSDFERDVIEAALRLRASTQMPFWEAVFTCCLKEGRCSDTLLDGAMFHSGQGNPEHFTRQVIEEGLLDEITANDARNVSLGSAILDSNGDTMHYHLFDFHCEVNEHNTAIVRDVCQRLMPGGFLTLDSGDSYHAISLEPTSPEDRVRTLGKALLFGPITDCRYIGHQLRQPSSSIRISKGGTANKTPYVVDGMVGD